LNLLFIGCNTLLAAPINKILENPREYSDKPVKISGEVTDVVGLVVVKCFVVKDKTGEIIVVTKRPLPKEGTVQAASANPGSISRSSSVPASMPLNT
jgi:hypothetical protein